MDVIVVGAGIIGCAIADEVSRRGRQVTVLDARTPGAGATQASAGVLAPYIEAHDRGPLFDLTVESLALYDHFIQSVSEAAGRDIEYRRCGTLEIADTEERTRSLMRAAQADTSGALEWIAAADLAALETAVDASAAGALLCTTHGYVVVAQLMDALVAAASQRGVRFVTGAHVTLIRRDGSGFTVEAGHTRYRAARVVVAAGSWSSQLAIEGEMPVIRPVRGQLLRLRWTGPPISRVLWGSACYIVPWTDGTVLVGATAEDVGFDERATVAGVRDLLDAACDLLPHAWTATFIDVRAGLRPASPDGIPEIAASAASPGLIYATGHYRNGILLAPLTAQRVAALVDG